MSPAAVELPPARADWLLVFDRSNSWVERFDRFLGLKDAVAAFVPARSSDITIAATTFPRLDGDWLECRSAMYAEPELAWGATAEDVTLALDEWGIVGESALGPALAGVGVTAAERHAAMPDRSTSIVLLTDATPDDDEACDSEWDEVTAIAAQIRANGAGPEIHVVSVMGPAVGPDHFTRIGQLAEAGGGYAAFVNGSRTDVSNGTQLALDDLQHRALTCTRSVPAGIVPTTLRISSPDGHVTDVPRVASAADCRGVGFFLDDPDAPTTATLCSGPRGIGGLCEVTYVRASEVGAPTITAIAY